jgi:hypothetical protein
MSGVVHHFECLAHGVFEQRVKAGTVPKCPKGCGKAMVKLVFLQAPRIGKVKYKRGDRLLREAAELQGLSDISTSPSRPGGHVMDRIRKKYGGHLRPEQMPVAGTAEMLGALTHRTNALNDENMRNFTAQAFGQPAVMGHEFDKSQWATDKETGKVRHVDIPHTNFLPRASVERVREKPK